MIRESRSRIVVAGVCGFSPKVITTQKHATCEIQVLQILVQDYTRKS